MITEEQWQCSLIKIILSAPIPNGRKKNLKQVYSLPLANSLTGVFQKNPVGSGASTNDSSERPDRVHQSPRPVHIHSVPSAVHRLELVTHNVGSHLLVVALHHHAGQTSQPAHSTDPATQTQLHTIQPILRASLSGTFLQTLPELVTPLFKGVLVISVRVSTDAVNARRISGSGADCGSNIASKHAHKHEARPPGVKEREREKERTGTRT